MMRHDMFHDVVMGYRDEWKEEKRKKDKGGGVNPYAAACKQFGIK